MKPMILISLNTGLRKGELLNLKWNNINFALSSLTVTSESAKSGKARHIPLNHEAIQIFKSWREQTDSQLLVFPSKTGKRFTEIKKSWARVLKFAEIENF